MGMLSRPAGGPGPRRARVGSVLRSLSRVAVLFAMAGAIALPCSHHRTADVTAGHVAGSRPWATGLPGAEPDRHGIAEAGLGRRWQEPAAWIHRTPRRPARRPNIIGWITVRTEVRRPGGLSGDRIPAALGAGQLRKAAQPRPYTLAPPA
jgi:hypothetical protein